MAVSTEGFASIMQNLNALRKEGNHDLVIHVGERQFLCHRHLIAAACPVLKPMLLKENWENEKPTLNDIDPGLFEIIMEFVYTGVFRITNDNSLNLLKVTDYLGMDYLMKKCKTHLGKFCPTDDLMEAYDFACHLKDSEFMKMMRILIARNLDVFDQDERFLSFSLETIKLILEENLTIMRAEYCCCDTPSAQYFESRCGNFYCGKIINKSPYRNRILRTIGRWTAKDVVSRIDHLYELQKYGCSLSTNDCGLIESWKNLLERHRIEFRKSVDVCNEKIHVHIQKNDKIMTYTKFSRNAEWFPTAVYCECFLLENCS